MDNTKADKQERRTALVARELACYNVDLAALRETPLAAKGQLIIIIIIIIIIGHFRAPFLNKKLKALYNTFNQQSQILHNNHSCSHSIYQELSALKHIIKYLQIMV